MFCSDDSVVFNEGVEPNLFTAIYMVTKTYCELEDCLFSPLHKVVQDTASATGQDGF